MSVVLVWKKPTNNSPVITTGAADVVSPSSTAPPPITIAAGAITAGTATVTDPVVAGTWDIEDDFGAGNPSGWDSSYWGSPVLQGGSPPLETVAVASPPGTPLNGLEQYWNSAYSQDPGVLSKDISAAGEGSILEWDFWLKYDANFDFSASGNESGYNHKGMIISNTSSSNPDYAPSQLYFMCYDSWAPYTCGMYLQNMTNGFNATDWESQGANENGGNIRAYSNTNGNLFTITPGTWYHFEFSICLADENLGVKSGYLHGYIDGVLRYNYNNVYTWRGGNWNRMSMFNANTKAVFGANQKRWWYDFKFRIR